MGKRGPAKSPQKVLELRGSWRADEREGTLEVDPAIPDPVFPLTGAALKEWKRLCPILYGLGVLGEIDGATLTALCAKWGEYVTLSREVLAEGVVVEDERGKLSRNPKAIQASEAFSHWERLMKQFGLSPSSRADITVDGNKKPQTKEAKFFGT